MVCSTTRVQRGAAQLFDHNDVRCTLFPSRRRCTSRWDFLRSSSAVLIGKPGLSTHRGCQRFRPSLALVVRYLPLGSHGTPCCSEGREALGIGHGSGQLCHHLGGTNGPRIQAA